MITKKGCELLRFQAKQTFDKVKGTWIDNGRWALPHRVRWMLSQTPGERNNQHIVDGTHILALRSYVAGFLEGNTSATRPWFRMGTSDPDVNLIPAHHQWLDKFTRRCHQVLTTSNFYNAAPEFYTDYGVFNTGAHYIEELPTRLHFHTLVPGSYFVINNGYKEAVVLVREFCLTVKAVVDTYGKRDKKTGKVVWDNISDSVKKLYNDGNYTQNIDIVHIIKENDDFDPRREQVGLNKKWISVTYEVGGTGQGAHISADLGMAGMLTPDPNDTKYLSMVASKRKPFIVGKSTETFEYGEKGPTQDALGLIKSLQKKAVGKDVALDLMLRPPTQGPASLRKSYVTIQSNKFMPLDPTSLAAGGLKPVFEVNPAIAALNGDVQDLRQMVEKIYYADYLLYLSRNPKTRTAREVDAVVQEQQTVIGPNLQSLNWTYNFPIVDFVADYVLFDDPFMQDFPPPESLANHFLRPEFISVFAQAQRAADLPNIERWLETIIAAGQHPGGEKIWEKANLDKLADILEDRLFLPAGLNVPQAKVDAMREQAMAQAQQQQMLQETMPAMAGAAQKVGLDATDLGLKQK